MQRMYDEKYIKGMQMIHSGLIGDVVGMRCHWFRNADWRRPVPSPELERKINWRLYKDSSGGLMTELACHQLEVCNWAAKRMPVSIMGMGDIVYWKDGREDKEIIGAFSQSSEYRALQLTKAKEPEKALAVLDTALLYDSQNKSLKYTKGVVYEANRQADSAYYYQKYYEPSIMEYRSFQRHLSGLRSMMLKNEIALTYLLHSMSF